MSKLPVKEDRKIPDRLLKKYHAVIVALHKGETIFREGDSARSFFVVKRGRVKMVNVSRDGKEFVQGYFSEGESFGDPPFFTEGRYPASAIADAPSEIWRIGRTNFLQLLRRNAGVHIMVTQILSERLIYKSVMLSELAIEEAEHRIVTLLNHLRQSLQRENGNAVVPFSRQQLANMAGLRVETVIRIVKNLESKKQLRLTNDGKIVLD